jgi:ketosteroid isomerase-like protein
MDLLASYALAIDDSDADAYAAVFTRDAVLDHVSGLSNGRDAIRAYGQHLLDTHRSGGDPAFLRHFVGLPLLTGDGEQAHGKTLCLILEYDAETRVHTSMVGSYTDTYRKEDGRWKIAHRMTRADLRLPRP